MAVARLEFWTTIKRPLWWVLLLGAAFTVLSLSATALLPQGDGLVGSARPFINSEYALTSFFGLSGFVVYSFFASILAGLAVIRDDEHRISELIHSTPLTPLEYVAGKFLGVLGALGLVLVVQLGLLIVSYEVFRSGSAVGPFELSNYLLPAVVFGALPIVVFASLAFAVGAWTRKPMVVYAIPVALVFALPFFVSWSPPWLGTGVNEVLMILDPSGLRWLLQDVIRAAPGVEFVNTAPVEWDRTFWMNRLGLLGLSAVALASTVPHTRRVIAHGGAVWVGDRVWSALRFRSGQAEVDERLHLPASPRLGSLGMTTQPPSFASTTSVMFRAEVRELFSQPALYLFVPLLIGMSLDEGTSAYGPFGDALILNAGSMSVAMLGIMTFLLCAILLFFTVESVNREAVTGFEPILYACPVRTGALLLAKNLASAVLVVVLVATAMLSAVGQLALQDEGRVELWPFVVVWGLILTPTLVLWNAFVTAVLSGVKERYTTYAICMSVLLITLNSLQSDRMTWVYNWTAVGTLRWSDMGTFDLNGSALFLNRMFVLSLAVLLTGVAVGLFKRVSPDDTAVIRRLRPAHLLRVAGRLTPLFVLPLLLGGALAFKVSTGFQSERALQRDRDYWRQNVESWADFVPPSTAHVDLELIVEPSSRRIEVDGTYLMWNATTEPIATLPFTTRLASDGLTWTLDGTAARSEDRSGLHVLKPATPLLPGDSVRVGFSFEAVYPEGFTRNGGGVSQFVLPSGVVLHNLRNSFLPTPGFVVGVGLNRDNYAEPAAVPEDFWKKEQNSLAGPYTTRVEITAPSEYTMNSVGAKVAERVNGALTTVVWESDHPVGVINIVGAKWDVVRDGTNAVFYHPGHAYNTDEILGALVAARERYSEWFYPYPWKELRLNEYPNQDTNAMGFPTNIPFSEGLGFLAQSGAMVPTAFVVTAHETAHQWWGNVLAAGSGPGTGHLVEGMATYSAMLLLEAEHGARSRMEYARQMEASYLQSRQVESELSLARTIGDQGAGRSVVFQKGAWVQWMLQDHMGRERMFSGLQEFIRHYADAASKPALQHMLGFLRPHSPDSAAFDAFVDQWFFDVVLPEIQIADARVLRIGSGWEVSATLRNVGTGVIKVDVAAARGERFGDETAAGIGYRRKVTTVRLQPDVPTSVLLKLEFEPDRLIVDPDVRVLQRNRIAAAVVVSDRGSER